MIVSHHRQACQSAFGRLRLEDHRQLLAKEAHDEAPESCATTTLRCVFVGSCSTAVPGCASLEELENSHASRGLRPRVTTASTLLPLGHDGSGVESSATFTLYNGSRAVVLA